MINCIKSTGLMVIASLAMTACSGLTVTPPDQQIGKRGDKLGQTPGLLVQDDEKYDNGYTVFSTDPSKKTALNPNGGQVPQQPNQPQQAPSNQPVNQAADPAIAQGDANYQEFKRFQQYDEFKNSPEKSAERSEYEQWKEWQNYRQWKQSSGQ